MNDAVRIGIIGDFHSEYRSHHATNDSLQHAAAQLNIVVESEWVPTPSLMAPDAREKLQVFDGLWAAPGSPYDSFDGMLRGIQFARECDWPFLGTCGGFQYAWIELLRNVAGIRDADSAENGSLSKNIVIRPIECATVQGHSGAKKLSGLIPEIRLRPGSYLQSFYGREKVSEEFFCNFEVNPEFEWAAIEAGFPVVARGENGEIRAIESSSHKFFVATLFQPQLASTPQQPHPLVVAFMQAASEWVNNRQEDSLLE
jgi:CTP synthase (UTP-ammonia lyase)